MQRGNYINLVAFWIVARSLTRTHTKADDRQSTRERTLSGPWAPVVSLSFHLRSAFTPRFTFWFLRSRCHMTASLLAFGSYPWICENVARAACTLWSRGSWLGGALVSALCICCFLAHRLLYGSFAVCCFALVFPCHTNPWGDTMLSSLLARFNCLWTDQLTTGRACFCCVVLCVCWCCCLFLVFVCFSFVLHGDSPMDYVSSYSVLFCMHTVVMTDVATALIRWICKMLLSFRLDKRPGESHLALDRKKVPSSIRHGRCLYCTSSDKCIVT